MLELRNHGRKNAYGQATVTVAQNARVSHCCALLVLCCLCTFVFRVLIRVDTGVSVDVTFMFSFPWQSLSNLNFELCL